MPELPEVEYAARVLRAAMEGKAIDDVLVAHRAIRRTLPARAVARIRGRRVRAVERRGKHQLLRLDDGSVVHVHFRMTGDWLVAPAGTADHPHARATFVLDDGSRVMLVDSRALATVRHVATGEVPLPELGLEATDPALDVPVLARAFRGRRAPIKVALLDQRVVAGLGNIYAAEALWAARIDPRAAAASLGPRRLARLVDAIRETMTAALGAPGRYRDAAGVPLRVYDREGAPCPRCGAALRRIVQAGRSTYFCPRCQRA